MNKIQAILTTIVFSFSAQSMAWENALSKDLPVATDIAIGYIDSLFSSRSSELVKFIHPEKVERYNQKILNMSDEDSTIEEFISESGNNAYYMHIESMSLKEFSLPIAKLKDENNFDVFEVKKSFYSQSGGIYMGVVATSGSIYTSLIGLELRLQGENWYVYGACSSFSNCSKQKKDT